jgi:acyl-CoA synthetase (AMP-forming)/AMP-acid ligase II
MKNKINSILKFRNFSEVLSAASIKYKNIKFINYSNKNYTFEEFDKIVNCCCNFFFSIGLKKKDIICINFKNSIEFLIIYFSSIRYGTILNPLPITLSNEEVIRKINLFNAKFLFTSIKNNKFYKNKKTKVFYLDQDNFLEFISKFNSTFKKKHNEKISMYYYSSGTTSEQKIIEYSNKAMIHGNDNLLKSKFCKYFSNHLVVLPLAHTASLRYSIKQSMITGSTIYLYENFWSIASNFWKIIEKNKINFVQIVPSILQILININTKSKLKTMNFIGCGSSILNKILQEKFEKKFNIKVSNLYGLSEAGATHYDNINLKSRIIGNLGKPFKNVKSKIYFGKKFYNSNSPVGEILIKTKGIFSNYYKNKKLYNKQFYKGWFKTGDLGYLDKKGYLTYVERKNFLIIKGGVNILPNEIDETILQLPFVKEVATIGIDDKILGEKIKSYIVLNKINTNKKSKISKIKDHCMKKLGLLKCPDFFEFVKFIPKTQSGKVIKRFLK